MCTSFKRIPKSKEIQLFLAEQKWMLLVGIYDLLLEFCADILVCGAHLLWMFVVTVSLNKHRNWFVYDFCVDSHWIDFGPIQIFSPSNWTKRWMPQDRFVIIIVITIRMQKQVSTEHVISSNMRIWRSHHIWLTQTKKDVLSLLTIQWIERWDKQWRMVWISHSE